MPIPHGGTGHDIAEAFLAQIAAGLEQAAHNENERAARHTISELSELTRGTHQVIAAHGVKETVADNLAAVVKLGRRVSSETKRICGECDDLYKHRPPATTGTTCAYCTTEAACEDDGDEQC